MKIKKILIPIFAFAICFFALWKWTYGFSAFTIYSYTLKAADNTSTFPDLQMIDQDGKAFNLKEKHKYVLINFVYLSCPSACQRINSRIDQIFHQYGRSIVPEKLEFVTVSFDLKDDNLKEIKDYRNNFGPDLDGWTFARPSNSNQKDFEKVLRRIGIWIYQVPTTGMFNHSLYLFLISPDNKIIKILDPAKDNNQEIIDQINQCLGEEKI